MACLASDVAPRLLFLSEKLLVMKNVTEGLRIKLERQFEKEMRRFLDRWYKRISIDLRVSGFFDVVVRQASLLKQERLRGKELRDEANKQLKSATVELLKDLLKSDERRIFEFHHRKWIRRMYELGAVLGLKIMGFPATSRRIDRLVEKQVESIVFELTDQEIINFLEERTIEVGEGLTEEVVRDVRGMIRDGVYLGDATTQEIARTVAAAEGIPEWRALKIARTETQVAFNTAMNDMFERSGVKRHTWITVGDDRVRPAHQDNDDVTRPIGEEFPSGQIHPGDGAQSISCRCSIVPDLRDPSILLEPWSGQKLL